MNKETILFGVIGLLLGSLITAAVTTYAVVPKPAGGKCSMMENGGKCAMMEKMEASKMDGMSDSMSGMTHALMGKTGNEFDTTFLSNMIVHHEGAVEMAQQAKLHAQHSELKMMADEIISAQTKEINQMKDWQKTWGTRE